MHTPRTSKVSWRRASEESEGGVGGSFQQVTPEHSRDEVCFMYKLTVSSLS